MLEKERQERRLVRDIRIVVLLSSGMILKQKKERKLENVFLSGMISERIGNSLLTIASKKGESSNSSVWDQLNFENSRYTTVSLSCLGRITGKLSKRKCDI